MGPAWLGVFGGCSVLCLSLSLSSFSFPIDTNHSLPGLSKQTTGLWTSFSLPFLSSFFCLYTNKVGSFVVRVWGGIRNIPATHLRLRQTQIGSGARSSKSRLSYGEPNANLLQKVVAFLMNGRRMKCNKSRFGFRSKLMGICFSIDDEQLSREHEKLSSKGNQGHDNDDLPSKPNRQESFEVKSACSTPTVPKNVTDLRRNPGYSNVDIFTYEEMTLATKNFRPDFILGEGGFGVVYKGVIDESVRPGYQTVNVAIKELNPDGLQGDREWLAEVNYLGQLSHPNLVRLIGFCNEDEHRLLVYEYMASGSLERHLFRRVGCTLTWSKRMKIALDAAKGLAFLHGAERSIIYRDFKTSNILLDAEFNAKISDFGLAKDGPMGDQTHVSTRVMGTYGYAAPEYVMTGHLTARSDVYGFGVVLLELLLGRRALDKSRPSREHNLVEWARPLLNNKKLLRILDPRMDGQYSVRTAMKVANLAYQCLSQNPKGRPLMSQVVELLETVQSNDEEALLQNSDGKVTLYEDRSHSERRGVSHRSKGDREGEEQRSRPGNGRSKSEPPTECDLRGTSPDISLSSSMRN